MDIRRRIMQCSSQDSDSGPVNELIATYNVTTTSSETQLISTLNAGTVLSYDYPEWDLSQVETMFIDDVEYTPKKSHKFSTNGKADSKHNHASADITGTVSTSGGITTASSALVQAKAVKSLADTKADKSALNTLSASVTSLTTTVSGIDARLNTAEGEIDTLQSTVSSHTTSINTLTKDVSEIQTLIKTDGDDTINNLNEVIKFFEGVSETETGVQLLNKVAAHETALGNCITGLSMYVGTNTATTAHVAATNPYLNLIANGTEIDDIRFSGSSVTVKSTTGGVITFAGRSATSATTGISKLVTGDVSNLTYKATSGVSIEHNHDARYDAKYVYREGDTMSGTLNVPTLSAGTISATTLSATTISGTTLRGTSAYTSILSATTISGASRIIGANVNGTSITGASGNFTNLTATTVRGISTLSASTISGETIRGGSVSANTISGASRIIGANVNGTSITGATICGTTIYEGGTKLADKYSPKHDHPYAPLSHTGTPATTAATGHVKISNGDVATVAHADGLAAGMDHSHSNYSPTGHGHNLSSITAGTITLSGDVTGTITMNGTNAITATTAVVNDSHTHDGRYYTETEADNRFVNASGDTMTGNLTLENVKYAASSATTGVVYSNGIKVNSNSLVAVDIDGTGQWTGSNEAGMVVLGNVSNNTLLRAKTNLSVYRGSNKYTILDSGNSGHTHSYAPLSHTGDVATTAKTGHVIVGSFLSADTTGKLSIKTGTSSSTVARGDHSHDYDNRYVNVDGDTMSGDLNVPSLYATDTVSGSTLSGDIVTSVYNFTEAIIRVGNADDNNFTDIEYGNIYTNNIDTGYAHISGADIDDSNIANTNITYAYIVDTDIDDAHIGGATIDSLTATTVRGISTLSASIISGETIRGGSISASTISGASRIIGTNINGTNGSFTNLTATTVGGISTLSATTISGTTLRGTSAYTSILSATTISGTTLRGTSAYTSILSATTISGATIRGTSAYTSILSATTISGATIRGGSVSADTLSANSFAIGIRTLDDNSQKGTYGLAYENGDLVFKGTFNTTTKGIHSIPFICSTKYNSAGTASVANRINFNNVGTKIFDYLGVNCEATTSYNLNVSGSTYSDYIHAGSQGIDVDGLAYFYDYVSMNGGADISGGISTDSLTATTVRGVSTLSATTISGTTIRGGSVSASTISGSSRIVGANVSASTIVSPTISGTTIKSPTLSATTICATTMYATSGFYETSDERLKNFKGKIPVSLERLSHLKKNYFTWKDGDEKDVQIGVSAQEIQSLYPEIVSESDSGSLTVAYDKLSVVALSAIDVLYEENKTLKDKISKLESQIENINTLIEKHINK